MWARFRTLGALKRSSKESPSDSSSRRTRDSRGSFVAGWEILVAGGLLLSRVILGMRGWRMEQCWHWWVVAEEE